MNLKVNLLKLKNVKKAFVIANNAIHCEKESEYKNALYEICKALNPTMDYKEIGVKFIEEVTK